MKIQLFLILALLCGFATSLVAKDDDAIAIAKRAAQIETLLSDKVVCIGRPCSDRNAWDSVAATKQGKAFIARMKEELQHDIPLPDEQLYRDFYRTGNRARYEQALFRFTGRLFRLVQAECLENKGTFIPKIEESFRLLCNHPSWVLPAHDHSAEVYEGKTIYSDLVATDYGCRCAFALNWLGEKLSPEIRQLVRDNVFRRVITPYEPYLRGVPKASKLWWVKSKNNWNAVCTCGTLGAALSLCESKSDRAFFLAAAEYYTEHYFLNGFTPDGYCSEGIGYWNYGYGHFVTMAAIVLQVSNGKIDFLQMPKARTCLLFAPNMELGDKCFAAFADCAITAKPSTLYVAYPSRRLGLGLTSYEKADKSRMQIPDFLAMAAFYFDSENDRANIQPEQEKKTTLQSSMPLPIRTEFPDAGVLICRPFSGYKEPVFAVAMKGGHNNELHNHNDVGSYSLLRLDPKDKTKSRFYVIDPGGEKYTARTFSGRRYEGELLNSFGHPVPRINGKLQRTGSAASATVLKKTLTDSQDTLSLDLTRAYGEKDELGSVRRTFTFYRAGTGHETGKPPQLPVELQSGTESSTGNWKGLFQVEDEIEFLKGKTGEFETALISYMPIKVDVSNPKRIIVRIGDQGEVRALVTASDGEGTSLAVKCKETIVGEKDESVQKKPNRLGIQIEDKINRGRICVLLVP